MQVETWDRSHIPHPEETAEGGRLEGCAAPLTLIAARRFDYPNFT